MLRELADRQAITDLIHGYCLHFDDNEPEAVAALFTVDATVDYGPESETIVGSAAIATTIAVGLEKTFAATSHHVSNIQIGFDGPGPCARDHVRVRLAPLRGRLARRRALARHLHEFVRTPDGWRICSLLLQATGMVDFHRGTMHPIGRRLPRG